MTIVCQRIPEIVIEDKRLGRHIEHDEESKAFRVSPAAETKIRSVRHALYGGPLNQGNLGSCTGNAVITALNTKPLHVITAKPYTEENAVSVYSLATSIDEFSGQYPPDDTGSSGLAAAKAAQQLGLITEYRHAFDINEAMLALMERSVITGVPWYEGFDKPDQYGLVKMEGQVRGGHEFCVFGYEATSECVIAMNSWGKSFGLNGKFRFGWKVWGDLLEQQGDVTVLIR